MASPSSKKDPHLLRDLAAYEIEMAERNQWPLNSPHPLVNEAWDRQMLDALARGDVEFLCGLQYEDVKRDGGHGGQEIINWIELMGSHEGGSRDAARIRSGHRVDLRDGLYGLRRGAGLAGQSTHQGTGMKFASLDYQGKAQVAILDTEAGVFWPLSGLLRNEGDLVELISAWDSVHQRIAPSGAGITLDRATILAPISSPRRNIFCVGKNYHEHAAEFQRSGFDSSAKDGEHAPKRRWYSPNRPRRSWPQGPSFPGMPR